MIELWGTTFSKNAILALLRRDAEYIHKDLSNEELFAAALRDNSWEIPENFLALGAADYRTFMRGNYVPMYVKTALERSMAAGK